MRTIAGVCHYEALLAMEGGAAAAPRAVYREDALPYGSAGSGSDPSGQHRTSGGRLAQRESASFTPRRSLVRSQYRPQM
jgi:hypothetical protein